VHYLFLFSLIAASLPAADESGVAFARQLRDAAFDPGECYRVRDLKLTREDIRLYLTDGFLVFAKPVNGRRFAAYFYGDIEGGDAEVLLLPPNAAERRSLASFTQSPTLNEHFRSAILLFSDASGKELAEIIREAGSKKSDEMGTLLASRFDSMLRNFTSSFEIRLVQDIFGKRKPEEGFFFLGIAGSKLGNFDVVYDPTARDHINAGQVAYRNEQPYFDVWTSFPSRSARNAPPPEHKPDVTVSLTRIEANLEPDLMLRAVTRLKVTAQRAGMAVLPFDISRRMQVTKVLLDGQPVEFMQRESLRSSLIRGREDDMFLVIPPSPLAAGESHELEFHHEGKVIGMAGNGVYYVTARGIWYPHQSMQFGQYDIVFRFPKALRIVATGEVVDDRVEGDYRIVRRKTSAPIRMAAFNLGNYVSFSVSRGPLKIEVYANRSVESALTPPAPMVPIEQPPQLNRSPRRSSDVAMVRPEPPPLPNPTARLETLANEIADAFEFMSARFGPPPLNTLSVSPIPAPMGQGFPGMIYLSTIAYLEPAQRPASARTQMQELFFSEILHAHETAHQWWGNRVASAAPQDEWLMEALANYSALLYLEKRRGVKAVESVLEQYRGHLLEKDRDGKTVESAGPINRGVRLISSQSPAAWRIITYEKGSWIMHMLRRRLGNDAFLAMLRECVRRYSSDSLSTAQFRALAAEFLPKDSSDPKLENFFEAWVYGTGIPALKMTWKSEGRAPAITITGTLTQTGAPEDFEAFVPVQVQFARGAAETHWVKSSGDPVTFTFKTKLPAIKVLFDPHGSVLLDRK
jgi:hypothetical protein